jgi:hypothetical protein
MSTLYGQFCEQNPNNWGYLPNECAAIDNDLREYDHSPICEKSLIILLQSMQEKLDDLRQEVQDLKEWKYDINYQMGINDH